jgi:hypothetical protein
VLFHRLLFCRRFVACRSGYSGSCHDGGGDDDDFDADVVARRSRR